MCDNLKLHKKQILLDPVALFSSQYPDADASRKSQLVDLCVKKQLTNEQLQQSLEQTKTLSRQIGEAKRNNQPTDELIDTMQENSAIQKHLATKLGDVEQQILGFFVISDDTSGNDNILLNKENVRPATYRQHTTSIENIDEITVDLLHDEHKAWNDYVSKQPAATIHHRTEWIDLFRKTYGLDSFYFFAHDTNNQIVGILPLTRLKSRLFGDLLVSMPYFQRGGAIADHPLIEQKLMWAANEHAARTGIDHIEYRDDIPREGLPVQSHKVNMVLPLPASEDELWKSFTPKLRAQIKRPQRTKPQAHIGSKELLNDFYKVYTRNMRDLGSPAHSRHLIENILDSFENSWIIVLRLKNKPVSAGLLLGHGDTMEIPLASTIRDVNQLSMNMMLYWEALKLTIEKGYRNFDFGRSSKNAGTYRFKQQWGAQPKQLYWHYWLGNTDELPSLNPSNPKYAFVVNVWKRLPIALTKWLGPLVVKNIP